MKSLLVLIALCFSFSSFAQWTHYGEESSGPNCNTYHAWEIEGCEAAAQRQFDELDHRLRLQIAKQKLMESDPQYIDMLSSFKGCESVDVLSKNLDRMNHAELCRRQLMDRLEKSGYFEELEANFN